MRYYMNRIKSWYMFFMHIMISLVNNGIPFVYVELIPMIYKYCIYKYSAWDIESNFKIKFGIVEIFVTKQL